MFKVVDINDDLSSQCLGEIIKAALYYAAASKRTRLAESMAELEKWSTICEAARLCLINQAVKRGDEIFDLNMLQEDLLETIEEYIVTPYVEIIN